MKHSFAIVALLMIVLLGIGRAAAQEAGSIAAPASEKALEQFLKPYAERDFLTFPETREHPIRLFDAIPEAWTAWGPEQMSRLEVRAQPGEYLVFQIGVYAHRSALSDVRARWDDLEGQPAIGATSMTCINLGGIDYQGHPFQKRVDVKRGRVQPLWFGVAVPSDAAGPYHTRITIEADGAQANTVEVLLFVEGDVIANSGFDRGKSLSRLAWLNTTLGMEGGPTRGFLPLERVGRRMEILGRTLEIGDDGLPSEISTFFEPSNQFLLKDPRPLLKGPFRFVIEKDDGSRLLLRPRPLEFTLESPSTTAWMVEASAPGATLSCSGRLEFDGFMEYSLTLRADSALGIKDIRLEVPLCREMAPYMMGLNHEGGLRPAQWNWHWDTTRNQDMLWIGAVNGGLRLKWKAENYRRPLINLYYAYGPLHLPPSWGNAGRGGVKRRGIRRHRVCELASQVHGR